MKIKRKKTRAIHIGDVTMGDGAPVRVQSMVKAPPHDAAAILRQARALKRAGCEIVRLAVPDKKAADVFAQVKQCARAPLVADIHFNKQLAMAALDAGADGVRVNPGNLGGAAAFRDVLAAARRAGACVRIGVNAGSLPPDILKKYHGPTAQALVESALRFAEVAEKKHFRNIKISLKASDVTVCIDAYRLFARQSDVPLHIGITEAGGAFAGGIRSAVGLGVLLAEGIGDTLRVSLTAPAVREVQAAWHILGALDLRRRGAAVVSCPTCGRTRGDVQAVARRVENALAHIELPIKIAVMGCPVNGPGEAREADLGAALGTKTASIFMKGVVIKKVANENVLPELLRLVEDFVKESKPHE